MGYACDVLMYPWCVRTHPSVRHATILGASVISKSMHEYASNDQNENKVTFQDAENVILWFQRGQNIIHPTELYCKYAREIF